MDKHNCLESICKLGAEGFIRKYKHELMEEFISADSKIVWIHGAGCSGCTMSFFSCDQELLGAILERECIIYHKTLLEQSGFFVDSQLVRDPEVDIEYYLEDIEKTGGYILVVEGALVEGPENSGKYCLISGKSVRERIIKAAARARVILALGTCASCGGVPGDRRSENVVRDFPGLIFRGAADRRIILEEHGISKPVINLPGCPPKPEQIMALLALLLLDKIRFPEDSGLLDDYLRLKIIKGG